MTSALAEEVEGEGAGAPGAPGAGAGAARRPVHAPSAKLLVAEPLRAAAELVHTGAVGGLLRRVRRGDGHGVMVMPGLGAGDFTTVLMRRLLVQLGYHVEGWELGRNIGPTAAVVDALPRRVGDFARRSGGPVSLVGWSLGGVFAREVGRARPDAVRQVITLASPFRTRAVDRTNASALWKALSRFHARGHGDDPALTLDQYPPPVPTTCIYSRSDGIVRWYTCIDTVEPQHENIAVQGSHLGMGHNAAVLYAVADRLSQPAGTWAPFEPPPVLRPFYPAAVSWDPLR
jgi:pimeloyl-ACP methyl ester carboxylesterase